MRDSFGLAISALFVLAGVFVVARGKGPVLQTIWPAVFFALCGVVFAMNMLRRRRERQSATATSVSIVGGVRIPMHAGRMLTLGVAVGGMGALIVAAQPREWGLRVCAYVMVAAGAAVLIGVATGGQRTWIQFDPEGLRIAYRRFAFVVPWGDIESLSAGEMYRNPWVGLTLRRIPEDRQVQKMVRQTRGFYRCDIVIMPQLYGLDAVLLSKAIHRYASEPQTRAELAAKPALPA